MDAARIEEMLARLALDGKDAVEADGFRGFPILRIGGATLLARQKTVLARQPDGRYLPRPGAEFVIIGRDGRPAGSFAGKSCYAGVNQLTADEFARRFGHLFAVSEIVPEEPEDRFAALLSA